MRPGTAPVQWAGSPNFWSGMPNALAMLSVDVAHRTARDLEDLALSEEAADVAPTNHIRLLRLWDELLPNSDTQSTTVLSSMVPAPSGTASQLAHEIGELLGVPVVDLAWFGPGAAVGQVVPAPVDPQPGIGALVDRVAVLQAGDVGDAALEGRDHQVHLQLRDLREVRLGLDVHRRAGTSGGVQAPPTGADGPGHPAPIRRPGPASRFSMSRKDVLVRLHAHPVAGPQARLHAGDLTQRVVERALAQVERRGPGRGVGCPGIGCGAGAIPPPKIRLYAMPGFSMEAAARRGPSRSADRSRPCRRSARRTAAIRTCCWHRPPWRSSDRWLAHRR